MEYKGVIIEESLENKDVLGNVKILSTKIEPVTENHKTPWIKQWTLHTVEVSKSDAEEIAEKISKSLDSEHNWYADFKNEETHFIIFRGRVFKVNRTKKEEYDTATKYGLTLGIPDYQLDFSSHIKKWER